MTNDISNSEVFLKEFSRKFYQKVLAIGIEDKFYNFKETLSEFIINTDKYDNSILKLMENHKESEFWFSSIIGFFYQSGIHCPIDKSWALELYLLAVNNERQKSTYLHLLEKNDNEFDVLQRNNILIGKYLLSLFYYKDIIFDKRIANELSELSDFSIKSSENPIKVILRKLQNKYFKPNHNSSSDEHIKFEKYLQLANNGCAKSQCNLGACYYYGRGTIQDYTKAFEWYSKSANNGYAEGQSNLGICYYYGRGVTQDYDKAFEWNFKSANNGNAKGQNNLGECYYYGRGTTIDYNKAFKWYSKSASKGCAEGQNNLGYCYKYGYGTTQNYKKEFKWFSKSAKNGSAKGQNNLGECYYRVRNRKKAFEWYFKSAHNGHAFGQYNLGYCHHYGIATKRNIKEAIVWYKKASDHGITEADNELDKIKKSFL